MLGDEALEADDATVVDGLCRGEASARVEVDDPDAVALALVEVLAGELVDPTELDEVLVRVGREQLDVDDGALTGDDVAHLRELARRVELAGTVVDGAEDGERTRAARLLAGGDEVPAPVGDGVERPIDQRDGDERDDHSVAEPDADPHAHHHADRVALRFALVILVAAQLAGIAVFVVGGDVLALVAPAVALAWVGIVVRWHRRPHAASAQPDDVPVPGEPAAVEAPPTPVVRAGDRTDVPDLEGLDLSASPAVRAATAHLRREQAAWKVAWWALGRPVPDHASWEDAVAITSPTRTTLVVLDEDGALDRRAYATTTAELPAAVRLLVVAPRSG